MRRLRHRLAWLAALAALAFAGVLPLCGDCGSCGSACPGRDACHETATWLDGPSCCASVGPVAAADAASQLAAKVVAPLPEVAATLPRVDGHVLVGQRATCQVSRTLDRCTLFSSFLI